MMGMPLTKPGRGELGGEAMAGKYGGLLLQDCYTIADSRARPASMPSFFFFKEGPKGQDTEGTGERAMGSCGKPMRRRNGLGLLLREVVVPRAEADVGDRPKASG